MKPHHQRLARLWKAEYEQKGIPSSFRSGPSGAVEEFVAPLDMSKGVAVDIGCGSGRNSLYLAGLGYKVYGIDLVPGSLEEVERPLRDRIEVFAQSVTERWPIEDAECDLAIDAFCFKHITEPDGRETYLRELSRVLAAGGVYVLTLAGDDDGYYGQLLNADSISREKVIVDPANGIASVLYTRDDIEQLFSPRFIVERYQHKKKMGQMHAGEFLRSTHCFLMRHVGTCGSGEWVERKNLALSDFSLVPSSSTT